MAAGRRMELDSRALAEAIEERAAERGMSLRAVCEEVGVSQNTTTRLKAGTKPEADILLALLNWLHPRSLLQRYTRPVNGSTSEEE